MVELPRTFQDFPSAYTSFDQIPKDRRFCTYEDRFVGRDIWNEYIDDQYTGENCSHNKNKLQRVEKLWKQFCEERDCHHALASPVVINEWCKQLLETREPITVCHGYLNVINMFYRYLMWNVEYPHIYNPVQFAAKIFETASQIEGLNYGDSNE